LFEFRVLENGGSRIICGPGKAAGGHRPRHRRLRPPEKKWPEFYWPLPVPRGKIAVFCRASDQADLSLFWLWRWRRCFQIRDGNGEVSVSRSDSHRCGKVRHFHPSSERTLPRGTQREPATIRADRNAPRGAVVLCEATRRHARGKSRASLSRRS